MFPAAKFTSTNQRFDLLWMGPQKPNDGHLHIHEFCDHHEIPYPTHTHILWDFNITITLSSSSLCNILHKHTKIHRKHTLHIFLNWLVMFRVRVTLAVMCRRFTVTFLATHVSESCIAWWTIIIFIIIIFAYFYIYFSNVYILWCICNTYVFRLKVHCLWVIYLHV